MVQCQWKVDMGMRLMVKRSKKVLILIHYHVHLQTLGLVFGGLVGGPLVKALIKRYNLKPENSDDSFKDYSKVESNEVLHRKYQPTQVFLSN